MNNKLDLNFNLKPQIHRHSSGLLANDSENNYYLKTSTDSALSIKQFESEENFYRRISNIESILPQICLHKINDKLFRVFPYVPMDLVDFVGKIDCDILVNDILIPLLDCLSKIHHQGVLHGDIKLENIRVLKKDDRLKVFLSDFGNSVTLDKFNANRIGALPQHIPPDLTLSPQFDIYSLGVIAFQLIFGFDFIKKFQMAGRSFEALPEAKVVDPKILDFIIKATSPSALYRFKTAQQAKDVFVEAQVVSEPILENYNLELYFEFYLEAMRETFIASNRSTKDYENFIGPWGETYYCRLQKWLKSDKAQLMHLKKGNDLIGISEAILADENSGMINTLFVSKNHRDGQCAKVLEASAVNFFKTNQRTQAVLNVAESNQRAIRFYKRLGWSEATPRQYLQAVLLKKTLL